MRWAPPFAGLLATLAGAPAHAAADQPHIVIIMVDDLGWGDLSVNGAPDVKTPHMDALVTKGLQFRTFYAHPDGFQTRAAIQTGRYPMRYGLQGMAGRSKTEDGLAKAEQTLAAILQEEGYMTSLVGSWGLGDEGDYAPLARGFDRHYGPRGEAIDHYAHVDPQGKLDWYRDDALSYDNGFSATLIAAEAVKVLSELHASGSPLYLQVAFATPHKPYQAPQEYIQRHLTDDKPERRMFQASIEATDDAVGKVVAELDRLGMREDTVVFFLSDNGGDSKSGSARNTPLRGSAGTDANERVYDGSMRVPASLIWEGTFEPRVVDDVVAAEDVFATTLAIVGRPVDETVDGRDIREISSHQDRTLCLQVSKKTAVVRRGKWKLIAKRDDVSNTNLTRLQMLELEDPMSWTPSSTELYDMSIDPNETNNVAGEHEALIAELLEDIRAYLEVAQPPGAPTRSSSGSGGQSGPPDGSSGPPDGSSSPPDGSSGPPDGVTPF